MTTKSIAELAKDVADASWTTRSGLQRAVESAIREAVRHERERCALECERLFLDEFGKTHEPIACAGAIRVLGEPE